MSNSVYLTNVLFGKRRISDIEDKITALNTDLLKLSRAYQEGDLSVFEAHFRENAIVAKRQDLEAELQARKLMLESTEKALHENVKKDFSLNVSA